MTPLTAIFQLFHGLILAAFVAAMPGSVVPDALDVATHTRGLHVVEVTSPRGEMAAHPLLDWQSDDSPAALDPEPADIDDEEETTDGAWTVKQPMQVVEPIRGPVSRGTGHLAYQVAALVASGRPRAPPLA